MINGFDMVKIEVNGEVMDLSSDFSLDIEETNPIFNEIGSQTVPVTVPPTLKNNRLTGFIGRLDVDPASRTTTQCVVMSGSYIRRGVLNITSASRRNGISFNIGFDNSVAYAQWQGKKLSELGSLPVWDSYSEDKIDADDDGGVSYYIDQLYRFAVADQDPLAVFPVVVEIQTSSADVPFNVFLNNPDPSGGYKSTPKTVSRIIDGQLTDVAVPPRYGLTPFVKVWFLVNAVFEDLGFKVVSNPFREGDLARLVVLNNVADALCTNKIVFAELMPDSTVASFLNALWVRFGFVYDLDYDSMEADLRLVKDVIAASPIADISDKLVDYPEVRFETPQYVTMAAQTSFEGAEPATERFEDFMRGYETGEVYITSDPQPNDGHRLSFVPVTATWVKADNENGTVQQTSTSFFKWDPDNDDVMEQYDLSSDDEFVPFLKYGRSSNPAYVPLYLTGTRHYHTYIRSSDAGSSSEEQSTPLAFLWSFTNTDQYPGITVGRLDSIIGEGQVLTIGNGKRFHETSLLFQFRNGLYDCFWRGFDRLLRKNAKRFEVVLLMSRPDLRQLKLFAPVVLNGVRCLIDSIKYTLTDDPQIKAEAVLRPLIVGDSDDIDWLVPDFNLVTSIHGWKLLNSTLTTEYKTAASCKMAIDKYKSRHGNLEWDARDGYARLAATPVSVRAIGLTWDKDPQWMRENTVSRGDSVTAEYKCSAKYAMRLNVYRNGSSRPDQTLACGMFTVELSYWVLLERLDV